MGESQKPTHATRQEDDDDDASFLPLDPSSDAVDRDGERDNISPAVRALMKQCVPADWEDAPLARVLTTVCARSRLNPQAAPEPPPSTKTKIYVTSRTHSQLSQLLSELAKTTFATHIRAVALGSRKNLCVNDDVRSAGDTGLDERCLDLQSAKGDKRCGYLPAKDEGGIEGDRGRAFGERVLVSHPPLSLGHQGHARRSHSDRPCRRQCRISRTSSFSARRCTCVRTTARDR